MYMYMRVCVYPPGDALCPPHPIPLAWKSCLKMSLQCLKGLDDFNFIQQSTMIARHLGKSRWKYATSYQHPSSGQCFDLKSFLRNETSPKSIGDPYSCDWTCTASAARIIICKLIDPNVMQTILEWEAESLNGLCIFCWLHSQMWQWPWWPTSNQAGQGRGAAIIWKKAVDFRSFSTLLSALLSGSWSDKGIEWGARRPACGPSWW